MQLTRDEARRIAANVAKLLTGEISPRQDRTLDRKITEADRNTLH
jgi:hypothetical protein